MELFNSSRRTPAAAVLLLCVGGNTMMVVRVRRCTRRGEFTLLKKRVKYARNNPRHAFSTTIPWKFAEKKNAYAQSARLNIYIWFAVKRRDVQK